MEVSEVKRKMHELEQLISKELREFERTTGTVVSDISLTRFEVVGQPAGDAYVSVRVKL